MTKTSKRSDMGTIGAGFLGGTLLRFWKEEKGWEPRVYDKRGLGSPDDINKAQYIFISVNTPYISYSPVTYWLKIFFAKAYKAFFIRSQPDFTRQLQSLMFFFELGYVDSAISLLQGKKVVIIHSTMIPFGTEYFKHKYPQHIFLFNPEFLRAKTAYEDFLKSDRHIIGYTDMESKAYVKNILELLPPAKEKLVMPSYAAEIVKLFSNTLLAQRVTMANVAYDLLDHAKITNAYYDVRKGVAADGRIGSWGWEILFENFRGWSGTCFPKDTRILRDYYRVLGLSAEPISGFVRHNDNLMHSQNLEYDFGYPKKQPTS